MKHMGLFEGIGGFSLAARWAGWETPVMVEWNTYCQAVLRKNFPDATIFSDIRNFDGRPYAGQIDIITGGFPCQPFSHAGKRYGTADDRYLWPEMLRVIREVGPQWVVGENVAGLLTMDGGRVLRGILADLENAGYCPEIYLIPAIGIGAPHRRDRVWIVAHSDTIHSAVSVQPQGGRLENENTDIAGKNCGHTADAHSGRRQRGANNEGQGQANGIGIKKCNSRPYANTNGAGRQKFDAPAKPGFAGFGAGSVDAVTANAPCIGEREQDNQANPIGGRWQTWKDFSRGDWGNHWYEVATRICGMDDGIPAGVDGTAEIPAKKNTGKRHRLEALGNAIVPQVAYQIFQAINEAAQ